MRYRPADGPGRELDDLVSEVVCGDAVLSATTAASGAQPRKGLQRNDRRGSIFDGFGDAFGIEGGVAMATGTEA